MEIKCNLKKVLDSVTKGSYTSQKVWVLIPDEKWPQTIELDTKPGTFDGVGVNAPLVCYINLRGREWTNPEGKTIVFNSLQCWKVIADPEGCKPADETPANNYTAPVLPTNDGDLPF
jgi:hypothetical protein